MKRIGWIIGAVVITGGFMMFAPPQYKDKVVGLATFYTDERQCFNHYKAVLNDADSAYLVSSFVWTKEMEKSVSPNNINAAFNSYDAILKVKIRARNGFGAYGIAYIECPLVNGKFDDNATFLYRTEK